MKYTIGTLVTDFSQYETMRASFRSRGFDDTNTQFAVIDNSCGNVADAYSGLRRFLFEATTPYVILCHQDIELVDDYADLTECLTELDAIDPMWAVVGNAGGLGHSGLALRISDPSGADRRRGGPFPRKVVSLDENFLLVRRDSGVTLSADLKGFHLYGADICMVAEVLGFNCYVIDFHLIHRGNATMGKPFAECLRNFERKWSRVARSRIVKTTCTQAQISSSLTARAESDARGLANAVKRRLNKLGKSRKGSNSTR